MHGLALFTVIAAVAASPVAAFEVSGASAALEWRNADDQAHQTHFTGGVELSFGAGLSTQVSVKNTNYAGNGDFGSKGWELHAIWRPQVEGLALGVFYGEEDFDPWFGYQGLEAKYEISGFSAEAAILDYSGPSYEARHMTLELGYQISDRFDVFAGIAKRDRTDIDFATDVTYLGASAKVGAGVSLFGRYSNTDDDDASFDTVTLGVRYDFGKGVTFQQRSYTELLPND